MDEEMRKALEGNPASATTVGVQLLKGIGRPKNEQLGRELLEQAHAHGLTAAAACLADAHRNGLGGPVDKERALQLLEDAAERGHAYCAFEAARMHRDGEAGQTDLRQACHFFQLYIQLGGDGEEATPEWAEAEAFLAANP